MTRFAPSLLVLLLVVMCVAPAQTAREPVSKQKASRPASWRLVDIWWDVGTEQVFDSLSVEVTISDDLPPQSHLFLAPLGLGYLNETAFQGGFQTQAEGGARAGKPPDSTGPGLIFTSPSVRSLDKARTAADGLRRGTEREGDAVSVVRPYVWTKGKYTYKIKRTNRQVIQGNPVTWVEAAVVRHADRNEVVVGSLRFPGDRLLLSRQLASFVELYTPGKTGEETPKLSVTLDKLQINGKPVETVTALAEYPDGVPDIAVASGRGDGVLITLGPPILDRKQRRVDLQPLADRPSSQPRIGKFELLATYTYVRALRDGLTENAAKERGITAAVMGARARGLSRAAPHDDYGPEPKEAAPKAKKKTLTADQFDQQIAHKLEPFFDQLLLPRMKELVATGISYQKLKDVLEMPPEVGAKMSAETFEQRTSTFLKNIKVPR